MPFLYKLKQSYFQFHFKIHVHGKRIIACTMIIVPRNKREFSHKTTMAIISATKFAKTINAILVKF